MWDSSGPKSKDMSVSAIVCMMQTLRRVSARIAYVLKACERNAWRWPALRMASSVGQSLLNGFKSRTWPVSRVGKGTALPDTPPDTNEIRRLEDYCVIQALRI